MISSETIANEWRFGDGAPVENAWKYSVGFPYAVAEAMLLARPGRFVTVFGDPTNLRNPALERFKLVSKQTRKPWNFKSTTDFRIHGDVDSTGSIIVNTGFTQFIHSWLVYQGLNTKTDFVDKVRTVNIKLAHRFAGFTNKNTLIVRSDQFSPTGTSTSLIIPDENVSLVVHSSPYKNRNFYSGVMIQKTSSGYKIRGYDRNTSYFNALKLNKTGRTSLAEVAGTPASYTPWQPNVDYTKETIVSYQGSFYKAKSRISGSATFVQSLWSRLSSLPQLGAVRAIIYLDTLPVVERVDYETEFTTHQDVIDAIIGIGYYQEQLGYDFGEFDNEINAVKNWAYSARQFLFWVSGGWQNNNILELSPLAGKVIFNSTTGMVAKINRVDRNQFTLLDQDGAVISPIECDIVRLGTRIEISPPPGKQIYATMLFTKEIEHAMVLDNVTNFNDTIFDPVYNQKQTRLRVKGKKTANWSGLFSSEGFIIQEDQLKPNLDNLAQSLGRYHELGFIPVEKQLYESARKLFGYQERAYMLDLEIDDDDQFEFYTGMIQNKGTLASLSKIARSNTVVQGTMDVYDEWALKVGDFGDLENDQTIELKLEKSEVLQDPQLITLAFPEDTTGIVGEIRVLRTKHQYYSPPVVEISAPNAAPAVQATATTVLAANGVLSSFVITNAGSGYVEPVRIQVVAGDLVVSNVSAVFNVPVAQSASYIDGDVSGLGLTGIIITDNVSDTLANVDLSGATTLADVADLINNSAVNSAVIATAVENETILAGNLELRYILKITGDDFSLTENETTLLSLGLLAGRYQPRQRYSISSVGAHPTLGTGATTASNIVVKVNNVVVPSDGGNNWIYHPGSRQSLSSGDEQLINSKTIPLITQLDANTVVSYGNVYEHASVYVNGFELINTGVTQRFVLTQDTVTINNVSDLPAGKLEPNSNVYVIENATVDFEDDYFGDIPGAVLNIRVTTNDDVVILTKSERIYEITPDMKGDEVILIDIDDSQRFLKKPIGVKEYNLWPLNASVDFRGINDNRYVRIPNSGYVNKSNVDFRSFDIPSIGKMFDSELYIHPEENDIVHVAYSENRDWNVYKLKAANTSVSYIEQENDDATTYLYTDVSLSQYLDDNLIGTSNSQQYLDHHLVLKNAQVSEKFVLWVNEQTVQTQQVRLSNITPVTMTEVSVLSIGPTAEAVKPITNITSAISSFSSAQATANIDGQGTVLITSETFDMETGDTVTFTSNMGGNVVLNANTYTATNVTSTSFTVYEPGLSVDVDWANLYYGYHGKTRIYSNDHGLSSGQLVKIIAGEYSGAYKVESASSNTFIINSKYVVSGPTSGNILLDEVEIVTDGSHNISNTYVGKRVAIHNALPRYYNQVYTVQAVTSNTIISYGVFPFAEQANVMTTDTVLTTLDHDTVTLNNSLIKVDNVKSVDGMCDSINRSSDVVRGLVNSDHNTGSAAGFSMGMPVLKGVKKQTGSASTQVSSAPPYVLSGYEIDTENLIMVGEITVSSAVESKAGFNSDPVFSSQTPDSRTATSLAGSGNSTVLNSGPFNQFNSVSNPGATINSDIVCISTFVADVSNPIPREMTNNNPKPLSYDSQAVNNSGAPIFDHAVLSAIPTTEALSGSVDPAPVPPRDVYLRSTIYTNTDLVEQYRLDTEVGDSWYYRVYSPGTVKVLFDLGTVFSNVHVYQTTTYTASGGTLLASTSSGNVRPATDAEKSELQSGNNTDYVDITDYIPNFSTDGNSNVNGSGVMEFSVSPDAGTYIRVDIGSNNGNSYRFKITYPSTIGEVSPLQNLNHGQPRSVLPYNGVSSLAELNDEQIPQTPIFMLNDTTEKRKTLNTTNKPKLRYTSTATSYNDFNGFSEESLTGADIVPSIFRKSVVVNTADQLLGYQELTTGYVNSSVQLTNRGILPLAMPMPSAVNILPVPIKTNGALSTSLGANVPTVNTASYFTYDPKKIDSTNYVVQPLVPLVTSESRDAAPVFSPLIGATPATVPGIAEASAIQLIPPTVLPLQKSPVDISGVDFNKSPVIEIRPKKKTSNGGLVAAGPAAVVPISKPTPGVALTETDVANASPGDQLLVNGTPITIADDPATTLQNIKDAQGTGFTTKTTTKDGKRAVKISSNSRAPLKFTNGTAGSSGYTEILDWHIIKEHNFTQTKSNATVLSAATGFTSVDGVLGNVAQQFNSVTVSDNTSATANSNTTGTIYTIGTESGNVTFVGVDPIVTYTIYDLAGNPVDTYITSTTTGSVIPSTVESNYYGGRGYSVGDRLRVVGGTAASDSGVPRPAKFVVTAVNSVGGIMGLKCIDRGLYSFFPMELDYGTPLDYDYVNSEELTQPPLTNSGELGKVTGGRNSLIVTGPGAGRGARLRMTGRTINVSEKGLLGSAVEALGLPSTMSDVSIPGHLADEINSALLVAGYPPEDLSFGVSHINGSIDMLVADSPVYDGIEFRERTPGVLKKLGIPTGDMNADRSVITASNATPLNDYNRSLDDLTVDAAASSLDRSSVLRSSPAGNGLSDAPIKVLPTSFSDKNQKTMNRYLGSESTNRLSPPENTYTDAVQPEVIALYSVKTIGGSSDGNNQDANSVFGQATAVYSTDLYQYELCTLKGSRVQSEQATQNVNVLYLESERYETEAGLDLSNMGNVWIDNYQGTGWAYLENGTVKRQQTPLVDCKYVKNAIIYDSETGVKEYDYSNWDPFKGVLPAFIEAELNFISESDPVVYNSKRATFGKNNVGQTWWDTSRIRYTWYEQGPTRERWLNWGESFPGSEVVVYEWVESTRVPLEYAGPGRPKNGSDYIIEKRKNPTTGDYINYYYFWAHSVDTVNSTAANRWKRKFNTIELSRYIANPIAQGINTISYITADSFVMSNLTKTLREDEQNIQINLSRNLNPIGKKHTAWKLTREADKDSDIPEDLIAKMIDSLCEADAVGNAVPAANLSDVERYGVRFRPRQTMFRYPAEARRVLHYVLNEILADIKLNTLYPGWDRSLTSTDYIETVNWYAVRRVDSVTNENVRFDDTSKAVFTVDSVRALGTLNERNLADGTIIMVKAAKRDRYQLWRWCCRRLGFTQIAIQNETVRLSDAVYDSQIDGVAQQEIRALIMALKDTVFLGTDYMNRIFFALMKYAYAEQQQLDWAFKTSYIYVNKEEEDLVQRNGFKPDNFEPILAYLNESKPYSAKIRDYKDGKKTPLEFISDQMISDFDKPPYVDPDTGTIRILDPNNPADAQILATNPEYQKWYSWLTDSSAPVRRTNVKMIFDRIDWRLLENDFDAANTSYTLSISRNISNINSANNKQVSNFDSYNMSARIFKFDPDVRAQFESDVDAYFGAGASSNTSITHNANVLQDAVIDGALNATLALVKQKVGGGWRGETLDANVFTKVISGTDSLTLQSVFGYDTTPWDVDTGFGEAWDSYTEVENYEGIFSGNVTFRREGVTYEGFDAVTFKRMLYGEERPEELVYLSPLENLVIDVKTYPEARDQDGEIVAALTIGPQELRSPAQYDGNGILVPGSVGDYDFYSDDGTGNASIVWLQGSSLLSIGDHILIVGSNDDVLDNIYTITIVDTVTGTITFGVDTDSSWSPANISSASVLTIQNIETSPGSVNTDYDANVSGAVIYTDLFDVLVLRNADTVYITGSNTSIFDGEYVIFDVDNDNKTFLIDDDRFTAANSLIAGGFIIGKLSQAVAVEYVIHQDMFGGTEFIRVLGDGGTATRLAMPVFAWDQTIVVDDISVLPKPKPGVPGVVWINNTERVEYRRIEDNKLSDLTRGTRGTVTPSGTGFRYDDDVSSPTYGKNVPTNVEQSHPAGTLVVSGAKSEVVNAPTSVGGTAGFAGRDPEYANWLRADGKTRSLSDITNRNELNARTTIGAFLQGDLIIGVGYDSKAWDSTPWDSL